MKKESNKGFYVCMQGFYGNRNFVEVFDEKNIQHIIFDYSVISPEYKKLDEIKIPDTDNLFILYSKDIENEESESAEKCYRKFGVKRKPSVFIPSENITLYGKCAVCKRDQDGNYYTLSKEDCDKFFKYLAE